MSKAKIAIIPARGGSKRIPRKNIKDFLGSPIITYSIRAAVESELFDEVMVSTDDAEIADIAKRVGANVPFIRSKKNSDELATTMDVIKEVISNYKGLLNRTFHYGCCIYPTAPLIQIQDLREGFSKLKRYNVDCVFPIVSFGYPIWRAVEIDDHGKTKMIWPEFLNSRSQDLKEVYHDAGQWYWFQIAKVADTLFTENTASLILNEDVVQDIDTFSDWKLAEMKYRMLHEA